MSSFNNIQRVKNIDENKLCIYLDEYMFFTDDNKKHKYVVFKFINQLSQTLKKMKVEISQFNKDNELIVKSLIGYNNFEVEAHSSFTPKAKLEVNYSCTSIKAKVIYALYDSCEYDNGEFSEIQTTLEDYVENDNVKINKKRKKKLKKEYKQIKKEKKLELKNVKLQLKYNRLEAKRMNKVRDYKTSKKELKATYSSKDVFNKNKPGKLLKTFVGLFFAVIACSSLALVPLFAPSYNAFNVDDVEYSIQQYNECYIKNYYTQNDVIYIEDNIEYNANSIIDFKKIQKWISSGFKENPFKENKVSMSVVGVGEGAFKNHPLSKITFSNENIAISKSAFENCKNLSFVQENQFNSIGDKAFKNTALKSVTQNKALVVGSEAYANCSNLVYFAAKKATVSKDAFKNDNKVSTVIIGKTDCTTMQELFGGNVPSSLKSIEFVNQYNYPTGFFYNVSKSINIKLPEGVFIDDMYGDEANDPKKNYTKIYGDNGIVYVDENQDLKEIEESCIGFTIDNNNFYKGIANDFTGGKNVTYITINSSDFDVGLLKPFTNLKKITFNSSVNLSSDALQALSNVNTIIFNDEVKLNGTFENFKNLKNLCFNNPNVYARGTKVQSINQLLGPKYMELDVFRFSGYMDLNKEFENYHIRDAYFNDVSINKIQFNKCLENIHLLKSYSFIDGAEDALMNSGVNVYYN